MKKPSRFLRILGAASLIASLLAGAFGTATVSAQEEDGGDTGLPTILGTDGVYFPWVANDDASTGLGSADTSVTIQNLGDAEALVVAHVGIGEGDLGGENGWNVVGPFFLEAHASKTFTAAQLGLEEGEGAPVAFNGVVPSSIVDDIPELGACLDDPTGDLNLDGDNCDEETFASDELLNGGNAWDNDPTVDGGEVIWEEGDCLVLDLDADGLNVYTPDSPEVAGGNAPGQVGANLDGNPADCTAVEPGAQDLTLTPDLAALGGVAKQAVDGENLPYTTEADSSVSGYNGLGGFELEENDAGWYLPIVQTNGGPGGPWNSIIRVANFGDAFGTIGAAAVTITIYPADNGEGELGESQVISGTLNAGATWSVDLSDYVPEGFVGSAHIAADAPVFAMVDRVKVGYSEWITNTATNAGLEPQEDGTYVLFAPDVRKDYFGWNTGINVANMADTDNTVTIQYYGDNGVATQTAELHANGMTYFYDPSQAPQDNSSQDPSEDLNAEEIGAAIIISDAPVAVAVDATKYPESTTQEDSQLYDALTYSATRNLFNVQSVPLVQKGNPDTGMGATSGIQLFNPTDASTQADVVWYSPTGDTVGNTTSVTVNPNAMTFVYTMTDANLSAGFVGSAIVNANGPLSVISTQADYQVEFDGAAAWNGYNPCGLYRTITEECLESVTPEDATSSLEVLVMLETAGEDAVPQAGEEVSVHTPLLQGGETGADVECGGATIAVGTTGEDGIAHFDVEPGDYCVEADPNSDGQATSALAEVEVADPADDIDATIIEGTVPEEPEEPEVFPGVADVEVEGLVFFFEQGPAVVEIVITEGEMDCESVSFEGALTATFNEMTGAYELEADPSFSGYCVRVDPDGVSDNGDEYLESETSVSVPESGLISVTVEPLGDPVLQTTVTIVPVDSADAVCADQDYTGGEAATYNDIDESFELENVDPGYYCAQVDFAGDGSQGVLSTDAPFEITSDDPADDVDASIAQQLGVVDFDMPAGYEYNAATSAAGLVLVESTATECTAVQMITAFQGGDYIEIALDADGDDLEDDQFEAMLPDGSALAEFAPGTYCAGILERIAAGTDVPYMTLAPFFVNSADPADDVDAELVQLTTLDVLVAYEGGGETPVPGATVDVHLGECPATGNPTGEPLFRTGSGEDGQAHFVVEAGTYCIAVTYVPGTVSDEVTVAANDPFEWLSDVVDITVFIES